MTAHGDVPAGGLLGPPVSSGSDLAPLSPRAAAGVQPYYAAYCLAHGRTPRAQAEHDGARWPGGVMAGFLLWIGRQRAAFFEAHPEAFGRDAWTLMDHAAWGEWLAHPDRRAELERGGDA